MQQSKEEILSEVLKGINDIKALGGNSLCCDDISPCGFDDVSHYVTKELDRLGYKLYSVFYKEDGVNSENGLKIVWEI